MVLLLGDIIVAQLCFATFLHLCDIIFLVFLSAGLVEELSKTKRVRIAEEVILEDESKPKKKKKDGRK